MSKSFNVLVLCTGNSARSILGEMLFKHLGQGSINAYSAGSKPGGQVNPVALETLSRHGVPCDGARSKSWDEFAADALPPAPKLDFIFTVCGNAAEETCPIWPGHPMTAHWPFPDPAAFDGPESEKREVFAEVFRMMERRVRPFTALPLDSLSDLEIQREIRALGTGTPQSA